MSERSTREIVNELYAAYARHDAETVAERIHDDIDWIIYGPVQVFPFHGPRRGKAAVLAALGDIAKDYELKEYKPQTMIVEGDRAAVMSDVSFMQRASGRLLRFHIADFLQVRDGKIVEFREFSNTFDVVEQALGQWLKVG